MTCDAGVYFDAIAILSRFNPQILVHLIPVVVNHEFDLLAIAGGDADAALIRIHPDVGAAGDGVGLGPFLGVCAGNKSGGGKKGPQSDRNPRGGRAQEVKFHTHRSPFRFARNRGSAGF